ncbi:hypothetical protein M408DRAFT_333818 [Serendipita vermifera MAFF 305830]|uniref:Uncharacterized protein n=1 Tax=Serendipita vermifera MAFF 305830 TaxID=933852 RepID=A0A0C3ANA5_SERVB|nr:hypothetical protein M408DRAFT_333818 [Serendipita vermifera MAFF 305830]
MFFQAALTSPFVDLVSQDNALASLQLSLACQVSINNLPSSALHDGTRAIFSPPPPYFARTRALGAYYYISFQIGTASYSIP